MFHSIVPFFIKERQLVSGGGGRGGGNVFQVDDDEDDWEEQQAQGLPPVAKTLATPLNARYNYFKYISSTNDLLTSLCYNQPGCHRDTYVSTQKQTTHWSAFFWN